MRDQLREFLDVAPVDDCDHHRCDQQHGKKPGPPVLEELRLLLVA